MTCCFADSYIKLLTTLTRLNLLMVQQLLEAVIDSCLTKKVLLKVAGILQRHYNKALAQAFSCEFCEIFKSTYFGEHLQTPASAVTESSKL